MRWISSSGDGDAAEAVAEIEAWLAAEPARDLDWDGVLAELREALLRAGLAPLLTEDAPARAILLGLAGAEDAEALAAGIAALDARADALLAARERAALAAPRSAAEIRAAETRRASPRSFLRL